MAKPTKLHISAKDKAFLYIYNADNEELDRYLQNLKYSVCNAKAMFNHQPDTNYWSRNIGFMEIFMFVTLVGAHIVLDYHSKQHAITEIKNGMTLLDYALTVKSIDAIKVLKQHMCEAHFAWKMQKFIKHLEAEITLRQSHEKTFLAQLKELLPPQTIQQNATLPAQVAREISQRDTQHTEEMQRKEQENTDLRLRLSQLQQQKKALEEQLAMSGKENKVLNSLVTDLNEKIESLQQELKTHEQSRSQEQDKRSASALVQALKQRSKSDRERQVTKPAPANSLTLARK